MGNTAQHCIGQSSTTTITSWFTSIRPVDTYAVHFYTTMTYFAKVYVKTFNPKTAATTNHSLLDQDYDVEKATVIFIYCTFPHYSNDDNIKTGNHDNNVYILL